MGYVLGKCPHCNNVMSMSDDSLKVLCPTCKNEVLFAEAAALAGNAPTAAKSQDPYYRAATESAGAEPAGGNLGQQPAQSAPESPSDTYTTSSTWENNTPTYTPQPSAPLLGTWKTNALFTALGIVAAAALNYAMQGMQESGIFTIFSLAYLIFGIVYAVELYPSFFADNPTLNSNEAISFLNGFVGGIIFGLIWNHNLTLKKRGVSHIVFVVLIAGIFVLSTIVLATLGGMLPAM